MLVIVVVVGALILAGIAVALSFLSGSLEDEPEDAPDPGLPNRELTADDVAHLRFRTGLRGYRMQDVDEAIARLESALRRAESRADERGVESRAERSIESPAERSIESRAERDPTTG